MYELFLTSFIEDGDLESACSILGGLCGMAPWKTVHRVLYFQGPPKPSGLSNQSSFEKPTRKDVGFMWKELHQNLSRQSFILQGRYEVAKDRDFGNPSALSNLDMMNGVLRWTDFPDPPHSRPQITQRKKVELWEQKKLPSIMRDNLYQLKTETVEEIYQFYQDDIEFCLTRHYFLKSIGDYTPLETRNEPLDGPIAALPPWESLTRVDAQGRWVLQVKAHVLQDNKPDEIRKAQDRLMAIRGELDGVFDFKAIDRKVHDTRVALQQPGVRVLPQKVKLGK
ncbi:unnamed protein product [Clonostachys chloroleuca]|uniref:Mediator of RNA polymerase II transcription subunit 18 n=1 Tax=Clonostachys chloroleuca TaxID=1926264 RepID=A0AA35M4I4_9HYPO|nr:unnamed protein product [Clonostachys chloroleuca]